MRAPTAGQDVTTVFGGTSNTFNLGHGTVCAQVSNDHAAGFKPLMQTVTVMGTSTANHFFGTSHTQNQSAGCNYTGSYGGQAKKPGSASSSSSALPTTGQC